MHGGSSTRTLLDREKLIESLVEPTTIESMQKTSPRERKVKIRAAKMYKMNKNAFKRFLAHQS